MTTTTTRPRKKPPEEPATAPLNWSIDTENILTDALAAAKEFAAPYGRTKLIAQAMSTASGTNVTRQMVGRWLTGESHPSFGTAVLLLAVVASLESPGEFARKVSATGKFLLTITLTPALT